MQTVKGGEITYLKVHIPWELMCRLAEDLKLRAALQVFSQSHRKRRIIHVVPLCHSLNYLFAYRKRRFSFTYFVKKNISLIVYMNAESLNVSGLKETQLSANLTRRGLDKVGKFDSPGYSLLATSRAKAQISSKRPCAEQFTLN